MAMTKSKHLFTAIIIITMSISISIISSAAALKTTDAGNTLAIENADAALRLEIDKTTGVYRISKDEKRYIGDGMVALRIGDKMLINAVTGDMSLKSSSTSEGTDKTGAYKSATLKWDAAGLRFDTEFRVYEKIAAVKFLQTFTDGYKAGKAAAFGDTAINFPVFAADDSGADMNVFAYNYQIWAKGQFGKNVKKTLTGMPDGFIATPFFVFDKNGWASVLSPYSDFLVRFARSLNLTSAGFGPAVAVGFDGQIAKLEPGRVTQSILIFSEKGVVDSMNQLGAALLTESGKKPIDKNATFFLKYLGYWTDNGGYYYYRTEPGMNYQDSLLKLGEYIKKEGIPVRHLQLDSWWYYKSKVDNGVYLWEPITEMFPEGLTEFQKKLGMPLTFHNRYFAIDTPYKDKMPFVGNEGAKIGKERSGDAHGDGPSSAPGIQPLTREVFDIWGDSVKSWDGVMYEQDWLGTQIERVDALRSDPDLAGNWMKNMNAAMEQRGLDIQYCMPTVLFFLESTRHPAVTNIRSSNDYYVRMRGLTVNMWFEHIYASALIAAMGAYPFKDVFITKTPDKTFDTPFLARTYLTTGDPNDKYSDSHLLEPYNRQEALMSILSAGPVGIGDRTGDINKELVMQMANEDGALVKPDRPIVPIEKMFLKNPLADKYPLIGYTQSEVSGGTWFYVFGAHVNELLVNDRLKLELSYSDLPLTGDYIVYDYYLGKAARAGKDFSFKRGVRQTEFVYLVFAPVDSQGRALIGDIGKLVPASTARIKSWSDGADGMEIELDGPKGSATRLLLYSEKAPLKVTAGGSDIAGKSASSNGDGWFKAEENLYAIDLAGGAGVKVKIQF